jgi:hypothetical protein
LLLGVAIAIPSCASNRETCTFDYTEKIRDEIAIPLVRKGFGAQSAAYYDYEKPLITRMGDKVQLLFSFDYNRDRNLIAVDPPYWGIDVNACTLRIIDSYEVSGTVISDR